MKRYHPVVNTTADMTDTIDLNRKETCTTKEPQPAGHFQVALMLPVHQHNFSNTNDFLNLNKHISFCRLHRKSFPTCMTKTTVTNKLKNNLQTRNPLLLLCCYPYDILQCAWRENKKHKQLNKYMTVNPDCMQMMCNVLWLFSAFLGTAQNSLVSLKKWTGG